MTIGATYTLAHLDVIQSRKEALCALWGLEEAAEDITIEFSSRLKSTLGRTHVRQHLIRLNAVLAQSEPAVLDEVLCHELAHVAAYIQFGEAIKPHGEEWAELVRRAGFEPKVRYFVGTPPEIKNKKRYEHYCPVCHAVRYAGRVMSTWRCASCVDAGLDGRLIIRGDDSE